MVANEKRLIDAHEAIERARYSDNFVGSSIWETIEVVEFLEDCPIIDAVEVVRCKDCNRCSHDAMFGGYWCNGHRVKADDFCSYGERRDNG